MFEELNDKEFGLVKQFRNLKDESGSHSPSIFTFKQKMPGLEIKVDACFLSNPYATDLFIDYFKREIMDSGKIRELLEFYPSQNQVIAEVLGEFLQVNPANVFVGNGAIEIIQAVIHQFVEKKILIVIPTFSSYYEYVKHPVEIEYFKLSEADDFVLDIDNYLNRVNDTNPDTIVLINPNNPNGGYIKREGLLRILNNTKNVKTVILDESFIHFAYEDSEYNPINTARIIDEYPNLTIIKSMSKDFGIAGIRAGYAVMPKERVNQLLVNGFLWNSNGLSEYFFRLYARSDFANDYNKIRIKYIEETITFIDQLKAISGINVFPSKANFVLIGLPPNIDATEFVTYFLIKYGIYLRTCSDKIGLEGEFIRVASRSQKENDYMLQCFRAFFIEN